MSGSIKIDEYKAGSTGDPMTGGPSAVYRVATWHHLPSVNMRTVRLWRPDNRYAGHMTIRRHESGGIELQRDALRSGAKDPPPIVVDERDVDTLILSLLEVRKRDS